MTSVVISQPMYFPWPGFFAQMAIADIYVWLDDVDFSKGSFTNRVQVLLNGRQHWMSIPLANKGWKTRIGKLESTKPDWPDAHRELLAQSLKSRPLADHALQIFDQVAARADKQSLCDTLISSCTTIARNLEIEPAKVLKSSELSVETSSSRRVLDIVQALGGDVYITGHGASRYLDHELFEQNNVEVQYMDYAVGDWEQGGGNFTPYVTTLDLMSAVPYNEAFDRLNPSTVHGRAFMS